VPEHARGAGVRLKQRGEHADRRRLAGAVGSQDAIDGTRGHGEVDAVDCLRVAEVLDEATGLDR
jgi:hypothetical protein